MRCASIDIGTNTLRLLVAEVERPEAGLTPLVYKRAITRLGGSYTDETGIDGEAAERTLRALVTFRETIDQYRVERTKAVATSVVRRARNRDWFLEEARKRTGLHINVISGKEEARLSVIGVLSVVGDGTAERLILDIGGGSTEFIVVRGARILGSWSMEMGVVHLAERHLRSDPPRHGELKAMEEEIKGVIGNLKENVSGDPLTSFENNIKRHVELVGTAGTVTTLASIDQNLEVYDRNRINNHVLERGRVEDLYHFLSGLTLEERKDILSLEKGREDLIIPGTAIVLAAMEAFGFDSMRVSDAGLLEGVILEEARGANNIQKKEVAG